jgi:hypothetical protein
MRSMVLNLSEECRAATQGYLCTAARESARWGNRGAAATSSGNPAATYDTRMARAEQCPPSMNSSAATPMAFLVAVFACCVLMAQAAGLAAMRGHHFSSDDSSASLQSSDDHAGYWEIYAEAMAQ